MVQDVILFGNRAVRLDNRTHKPESRKRLNDRVRELAYDLEFRRRWKQVKTIELWSDAAIFHLPDGTKWYLNIS
ncbi:hypothetical protein E5161_06020 [Cohnella pontilimi]|uniref:Uncharacterized protein n=1 Tax=Cohnella pontilimi TaxID=2564100 RepID=A0A4U0FF35_9BACL|nr:hypothetical protein [Cohnella pontilimi]TJY43438.1 hypothetical protein E5161_06020 [Cohnella pontilimi]